MNNNLNNSVRLQLFCAYSGLGYVLLALIGWGLVAGFLPAHQPSASAQEIVDIFAASTTRIRVGMILLMLSASSYIPFVAIIALFISRIERGVGLLTIMQIIAGVFGVMFTLYPALWWLLCAFRVERSADLILLINDAAWMQLVGALFPYLPTLLTIATASFIDRSKAPVFPKWVGYYNLWAVVGYLPAEALFFVKTGPFAWNGMFTLWIPFSIFGAWFIVMFWVLRKAILRGDLNRVADPVQFS